MSDNEQTANVSVGFEGGGSAGEPGAHKGVRGFELDIELSFARPLPRPEAEEAVAELGLADLRAEWYGEGEVRGARLNGDLAPDQARDRLRAAFDRGLLKSAELGQRGFLRSAEGKTEWMPWRRNAVTPQAELDGISFEEGVRYIVE